MPGMIDIDSEDRLETLLNDSPGALIYFSGPECNVCKVLRPKIEAMIEESYPQLPMAYVDCDAQREIAGQHRVFTIPTVLVFFDGREFVRKVRTFGIGELSREIERPYGMLF